MDTKTYLQAVLNTLDSLLRDGSLRIYSIDGIQKFSGCLSAINCIIQSTENENQDSEQG